MNQAVVYSLAMLYARTGEEKYLKLAEEVVSDFAAPGAGDYLRMGLKEVEFFQIPKPRWESLHPMMGLAELYWLTGDDDYRKAFEHLWWSIVKTDRHNNGGFSSGEQAQGNPYHQGAIKTCCTIAWMAMSVEMLPNGRSAGGGRTGTLDAQSGDRGVCTERAVEHLQHANGWPTHSEHAGHCVSDSARQRGTQLLQRQRRPRAGDDQRLGNETRRDRAGAELVRAVDVCNHCAGNAGDADADDRLSARRAHRIGR